MKKNYTFIAIDEGKKALLKADTGKGQIHWRTDLGQFPQARDMQRLDSDRVLIGYDRGYFICSARSGEILHDCRKWEKVTSAMELPDGTKLITGLNLEGAEGVCILTLDEKDDVIDVKSKSGDYVRLMRPGSEKSFLFCTNDHIIETDEELKDLRRFESEGFLHAWKPMVLSDGSILISAGYGAFMARFARDGRELQTFGRKEDVPEEVEPFFYGGFDITEEGDFLVANWQGHGPDNGQKGRQLLCFSPEGEYLESWSYGEVISSFQGILLLY